MKSKKISCVIVLILILFSLSVSSQDAFIYGDSYSTAFYEGTTKNKSIEALYKERTNGAKGGKLEKLTKEENYLLWGALNKYDYKPGEIYSVKITQYTGWVVTKSIVLFVEIQKDDSCDWIGFLYFVLTNNF